MNIYAALWCLYGCSITPLLFWLLADQRKLRRIASRAERLRFWFNRDGSPCDGFKFRECGAELDKSLRAAGYEPNDAYGKIIPEAANP